MFRLTREVRFAINPQPDGQLAGKPTNSYAGFPSLIGLGSHYTFRVTVAGPVDPASQYLLNIKQIDAVVRASAIPLVGAAAKGDTALSPPGIVAAIFDQLRGAWGERVVLDCVELGLSPFLRYSMRAQEHPMVRLSQKFEFSATHRLHNPSLSEDANRATFGKCNNPHGHGHNYEVQVTLRGLPDDNGLLVNVPAFERVVASTVIDRFDHKNLNVELPEFKDVIPSVENISMTIFKLLKPKFREHGAQLAAVTVWETPKTWCEYSEPDGAA